MNINIKHKSRDQGAGERGSFKVEKAVPLVEAEVIRKNA